MTGPPEFFKGHEIMDGQQSRLAKWGLWIAVAALVVLAVCIVVGNRTELIHFGIAVRGLAVAALIGLVAVGLSATGIVRTLVSNRSGARACHRRLVLRASRRRAGDAGDHG